MKKEYDEIMGHIEVTPEMRQRVLGHIRDTEIHAAPSKVLSFPVLKKYLSAACLILLIAGAVTLPHLLHQEGPEPPVLEGHGIVEAASLQELSEIVGFEINEEFSLPFESDEILYTSYWQDLAEIEYSGEGQSAIYRVSRGTEDNSGDFTEHDSSAEIIAAGCSVVLRGDDGRYTLAIWTDGEFSYSLSLSQAVTEEDWREVLRP